MSENIIGKLTVVATSFGLKVEGDDKWINPEREYQKTLQIDELSLMKGHNVEIGLNDKGYYVSVVDLGAVAAVAQSVKKEVPQVAQPKKAFEGVKQDSKKEVHQMKDEIDPKYLTKIGTKEYILHSGLLAMTHKLGIKSLNTDILSDLTSDTIICKATLILKDERVFTGIGDANIKNTNGMVGLHFIRMSETRAVNRAMRFATNTGICSADELGGSEK